MGGWARASEMEGEERCPPLSSVELKLIQAAHLPAPHPFPCTPQNLLNEPRCNGCPAGTVARWYDEMARFTKSVSGWDRGAQCDGGPNDCCSSPLPTAQPPAPCPLMQQVDPNHLVTTGEEGFYACCGNEANPGQPWCGVPCAGGRVVRLGVLVAQGAPSSHNHTNNN